MNIREIVQTDREVYRQLRASLDEESPMWGAAPGERENLGDYAGSQFDQVLESMRSAIFVAEEEDTLAGFLSLETSPWKSLSCTTTLMVGVLSSHQGKGAASQLFERSELWASDNGIHRIELLVLADNVSAIGLYKKLGYIQEGIRKESSHHSSQFVDEIYMAKLLQGCRAQ
jgi:ribosomal protein S18 acetylase RimI-like enzyme